jgi:hypothetical protein
MPAEPNDPEAARSVYTFPQSVPTSHHSMQNRVVLRKDILDNYLKLLYFLYIVLRFWAYCFGRV